MKSASTFRRFHDYFLQVDGPFYWGLMATVILSRERWKEVRVEVLRRILVATHVRHVMPAGGTRSVVTPETVFVVRFVSTD